MRARRTAIAALGCLALTAGCGMRGDAPATSQVSAQASGSSTSPAAATTSPTGSPASDAFDPAHAVAEPGPLRLPMRSADLLAISPETISAAELKRIDDLPGVSATTTLSLAQVAIEDRAMVVASVDSASYRRFTPASTARYNAIWNRVAGGEIAVTRKGAKRLPVNKDGYLRLGNNGDAPVLHVGAYADQVPYIDMVVNTKWGESLGMRPGNAVLISTGINSPSDVLAKLRKITGKGWSVQGLDAVARYGLDPGARQTAVVVGNVADAVGTYTYRAIGGGRIAPDPAWVAAHIATETMPIIGPMTCNKAMFPQLKAALDEIVASGLASAIHPSEYAGCFYPRFIAGTTKLSNHSFGLAFDINVPGNQRGVPGDINRGVVAIFKKWGFAWGGDWSYTDPMHFEVARLVSPK